MDASRIRQAVRETQDEAVALLQELIRIDTQSIGHGLDGREGNATGWLESQMTALGCTVDIFEPDNARLAGYRDYTPGHSYKGRPNVVGRYRGSGGGRSLILNTHIDVVPPGDESDWRYPPFSGTVAEGRVYRRGTSDTKSGMAVSLHALRILQRLGFKPRGDVILEAVVDEEGGGNGTLACVDRGYTADGAVCFEPTEGAVAIAHRGVLSLRILVEGQSGHAATKWRRGVSAIEKAMRLVRRLHELEHDWLAHKVDPYLPAPTITVGQMVAGIGPTTIPQSCRLEVDVKYLPREADEAGLGSRVKAEVEAALLQEAQADPWLREHPPGFEWYVDVPPSSLRPDHPFALAASEVLEQVSGQGVLGGFPAGCDARILSGVGKTPSIIYGPGSLLDAHAVDESVSIEAYLRAIEFTACLIARWTA